MNKLEQTARPSQQAVAAMQLALEALLDVGDYDKCLEAITALREALEHSGEANEMVGCAYCNNPLFAGTKCNNCGRVTLAEQERKAKYDERFERLEKFEQAEQEPVLQDIEQYRMQMAGISTAALGYWKEGDSIHPDYDTPALRDVAALYDKYAKLYAAPVRTKDLTDEEIATLIQRYTIDGKTMPFALCEAVIAADREKNK